MTLTILLAADRTSRVSRFPRCPLHGQPIIDDLPDPCPYRSPSPSHFVQELKNRAFAELGWPDGDSAGALDILERAETCGRCVANQFRHPRIRRLRARLLGTAR